MQRRHSWLFLALTPLALLLAPRDARAGLEACGNLNVSADAQCQVVASGGCQAQCTPVRFEAACAAKLETECSGQCDVQASVDCQTSCQATCTGQCQANPGSLDCKGRCEGDCDADCSGRCQSSANSSECQASCKASCTGHCDASCTGTPPSATCDARCQASCNGSCEAKVNADCQIQCQSSGYAQCKADLQGGCKVQCEKPEGALFCNGNYVDVGNNLQNCIDALNAILHVKVDANAQCSGSACTANATASASCAAAPGISGDDAAPRTAGFLIAGVGLIAAAARRRRAR